MDCSSTSTVLLALLVNFVCWIIARVATRAGADDLIFLLVDKVKQQRGVPVIELARAIYAAIADRVLWLIACAGQLNTVEAASLEIARHDSLMFYAGISLLTGSLYPRLALDCAQLLQPFHIAASFAWVCAIGAALVLYVALLWWALQFAAAMLENPAESIMNLRVLAAAGVAVLGTKAAVTTITTDGVHGALVVSLWLAWALGLAIIRSAIVDRSHDAARAKASYWGPGGRPFNRRDLTETMPTISVAQSRRRGRLR
jgi:hypothetical protein